MEITLEGGFTLQRNLHRRVAWWIAIAGGMGTRIEMELTTPLSISFLF